MSDKTPVHISILLDRSGSMATIADDIVGGFNTFLEQQRQEPGTARVTLVQFDGQDPFEILIDGQDLESVENLDPRRYQPRGIPRFSMRLRSMRRASNCVARSTASQYRERGHAQGFAGLSRQHQESAGRGSVRPSSYLRQVDEEGRATEWHCAR